MARLSQSLFVGPVEQLAPFHIVNRTTQTFPKPILHRPDNPLLKLPTPSTFHIHRLPPHIPLRAKPQQRLRQIIRHINRLIRLPKQLCNSNSHVTLRQPRTEHIQPNPIPLPQNLP